MRIKVMDSEKFINGRDQKDFAAELACALKKKQMVVFPADSMYAIAYDFFDEGLRERAYSIKGRPTDKKIYALMGSPDWLEKIGITPNSLEAQFIKKYWPGNLRIVFSENFAGGVPHSEWLRKALNEAGIFVATTSANISGAPPVRKAADLDKKIVDGADKVFVDDSRVLFEGAPTIVRLKGKIEVIRPGNLDIQEGLNPPSP